MLLAELYFTSLKVRGIKSDDINCNIKKGSAKYEQYDGCERRNGENGKNEFLSVGLRERKTAREEAEKGGTFIPSTEVSNICH